MGNFLVLEKYDLVPLFSSDDDRPEAEVGEAAEKFPDPGEETRVGGGSGL